MLSRFTALLVLLTIPAALMAAPKAKPAPTPEAAPVAPDSNLTSHLRVADDLEIELYATAPMFFNPTNLDTDAAGRLWVLEAVNYRDYNNKDGAHLWHEAGDRVMVLEDTDGDGRADKSHVFVQDKDLVAPMGLAVIGNRVFVSCAPTIFVYTDVNGDAKFDPAVDKKETFLTGFGGHDHDHSLHAVVAGPDGNLYFPTGNAGPHIVTDKAGWTLRAGSSYTGGSPYNKTNTPGLKSDDGRVYVGGIAVRIKPDGTGMNVVGHNFRNCFELCVDSLGNVFQSDNDDTLSCRVTWLMPSGNAGFASTDGSRTWTADQRPWQSIPTAHWHQEDPGVMPSGDVYGPGAPTGICIYENGSLPAKYEGTLLAAEAGRHVIWGYHPKPDGAGMKLERFAFLWTEPAADGAEDPTKWFRPSDVCVGADGAIYVADWFDPFVGGHKEQDTRGIGTIYRITKKGDKPRAPKIDLTSEAGQIAALRSPANNIRQSGRVALMHGDHAAALSKVAADANPYIAARAQWLLDQSGHAATGDDDQQRLIAIRAAKQPNLTALAADPSPAVRREVAVRLRDVPLEKSRDLLIQLAQAYPAGDRWYLAALGLGCDGKEAAVWDALRKGQPTDPTQWPDTFVDLTWLLHPPACVGDVAKRAAASPLALLARQQAVDTLAFVPTQPAADAMLALVASTDPAIHDRALYWARFRSTNDWKAFDLASRLPKEKKAAVNKEETKRMGQLRNGFRSGKLSHKEMEEAVVEMARSAVGGANLITMAARQEMPRDLYPLVGQYIHQNPDISVRSMAGQFFPRSGAAANLPPVETLAGMPADVERGKALFFGRATCMACHSFSGTGGQIGPDLTMIRAKFDRKMLLDSILNPSAAIATGYEASVVSTKDGQTLMGFIVADADPLLLRDAAGQQHAIPAADIASRKPLGMSLMPEVANLGVTAQDFADLAEFLLKSPVKP